MKFRLGNKPVGRVVVTHNRTMLQEGVDYIVQDDEIVLLQDLEEVEIHLTNDVVRWILKADTVNNND